MRRPAARTRPAGASRAGLGDLFKGRIANVYGNYLHVEYVDRSPAEKAIREPLCVALHFAHYCDPAEALSSGAPPG